MTPIDKDKTKVIIIQVVGSVLVALITTLGTIAVGSAKLENATREATKLTERTGELTKMLAASPIPVGTIVSSTLTAAEFTMASGDDPVFNPLNNKWCLADGRQVVDSTYHRITNGRPVPDLRGLFLRGMNVGRADSWKDPEEGRQPGVVQAWMSGMPRTAFIVSESGRHVHLGPRGTGFVSGGLGRHATGPHDGCAYGAQAMSESGNHIHTILGGDVETRPNNASVFFFIRINP